jgi:cation transport regulator ChaB
MWRFVVDEHGRDTELGEVAESSRPSPPKGVVPAHHVHLKGTASCRRGKEARRKNVRGTEAHKVAISSTRQDQEERQEEERRFCSNLNGFGSDNEEEMRPLQCQLYQPPPLTAYLLRQAEGRGARERVKK